MTRVVNGTMVIAVEAPQQCDLCGKVRELRPYGRNGEAICYDCMKKDEPSAKAQFLKRLRRGV